MTRIGPSLIPTPAASYGAAGVSRLLAHNALDFKAVPDGTTDNTTYLQNWINACQADGIPGYAPSYNPSTGLAGTYLTGPLTTINTPFKLFGDGMYKTVFKLKNASNGWLLTLGTGAAQMSSVTLEDLTLDGNCPNQTTGGGCLNGPFLVHGSFYRCRFTQGTDTAVLLAGQQTGGTAFGHNNNFMGCLIDNGYNATGTNSGQGVRLTSNDENFFFGCDFTFNGQVNGTNPFAVYDGSGTNYYVGCNFVGGQGGYKLQNAPNPRLTGCHFDGVGADCIQLSGTGAVITGCTFSKPGSTASNFYSGVRVAFNGGGHTIVGNQLTTASAPNTTVTRSFYREGGATIPSVVGPNKVIVGTVAFGTAVVEDGGIGTVYTRTGTWPDTGLATSIALKTANYSFGLADDHVVANAASLTVTLPSAVTTPAGSVRTVSNGPSGTSTTIAAAAGTIYGPTSLSSANTSARYRTDGSNWYVA